jgi:hypothetical protein
LNFIISIREVQRDAWEAYPPFLNFLEASHFSARSRGKGLDSRGNTGFSKTTLVKNKAFLDVFRCGKMGKAFLSLKRGFLSVVFTEWNVDHGDWVLASRGVLGPRNREEFFVGKFQFPHVLSFEATRKPLGLDFPQAKPFSVPKRSRTVFRGQNSVYARFVGRCAEEAAWAFVFGEPATSLASIVLLNVFEKFHVWIP